MPRLLQYVSNGNYYGRIKMGGKLIRESPQMQNANASLLAFQPTSIRVNSSGLIQPRMHCGAVCARMVVVLEGRKLEGKIVCLEP
jgi:hypothetical protein